MKTKWYCGHNGSAWGIWTIENHHHILDDSAPGINAKENAEEIVSLHNALVDMKTNYIADGFVYGLNWGFTRNGYAAKTLTSDNKADLINQIKNKLADGSLDSGMGYQSLEGALMRIVTSSSIEIDGKTFTNVSSEVKQFGKLNPTVREKLRTALENL